MWVATEDLPRSAAHPFYRRLNQIFDQDDFDGYVEVSDSMRTRSADAVSGWNGRVPTSMKPVGCAACTCGDITTFANGRSCMPVD